ncbi:MAG: hypothetical protein HGA94_05060 [Candidatus Aminicenantes bacterium]|nr:hypothetical protein [Candidatus Aminicenantes bacterium]
MPTKWTRFSRPNTWQSSRQSRPRHRDGLAGRPLLAEFLEWVLADGQAFVTEMGYIAVGPDRIASGLALLRGASEKK